MEDGHTISLFTLNTKSYKYFYEHALNFNLSTLCILQQQHLGGVYVGESLTLNLPSTVMTCVNSYKACNYHIWALRHIPRVLPLDVAKKLLLLAPSVSG